MNLFSTIKAAVTTRQAAEHFGLAVDKHGMARCPFRVPIARLAAAQAAIKG